MARKTQIKFYVTLEIEEDLVFPEDDDDEIKASGLVSPYTTLQDQIITALEEIADEWNGKIKDIEWK